MIIFSVIIPILGHTLLFHHFLTQNGKKVCCQVSVIMVNEEFKGKKNRGWIAQLCYRDFPTTVFKCSFIVLFHRRIAGWFDDVL